ncbi:MAG: hypothetical protein H6719_11655 [Sandaracinaceae bacterium]|nr:hypothetical protein [Sandaracinaceae bacterium]
MNARLTLWVALLAGCGSTPTPGSDGGAGSRLVVLLEAEATAGEGIAAGEGPEDIQDGWSVAFDDYVVVIGGVDVRLAQDASQAATAGERFAVDLVDVPEAGLPLWSIAGLTPGRWELGYALGRAATDGAVADASVSDAQLAEMVEGDWTYLIAGALSRADGASCPPASRATPGDAIPNGDTNAAGDPCYDNPVVAFRWGLTAPTALGPCEVDDTPGFAVTAGASTSVALTIHGDHLFFNGFPEGGEGGVRRLAQWLADGDLNVDGEVTREELEALVPADLVEFDPRFQLGGTPVTPLASLWDYVTAQVKTQGHFQGEGECALSAAP